MVNQLLCTWNYYSITLNNTNMKQFAQILKHLFLPKEKAFWIRVKTTFPTRKEKEEFIYATLNLLESEIKIK